MPYAGTCPHCGTTFTTEYASKIYCRRACKDLARRRRAFDELAARRAVRPSRWQRLRVALRSALGPLGGDPK